MWRHVFWGSASLSLLVIWLLHYHAADVLSFFYIWLPLFLIGVYDLCQKRSNVLRNYPVLGHLRYLLLEIRPQVRQYFFESELDGRPFSAEVRNLVYQRADRQNDTLPFGTQADVYQVGFETVAHSLMPQQPSQDEARILIGGPQCTRPYLSSRLNISAMSFGALSKPAIRALNRGACLGGFAHNTGEGGVSPYHLMEGGDLTWQIGTGYFGCRTSDGHFDPVKFKEMASHDHIKMIEIKLSQGAKPGHGGILPAAKVSQEIAEIRGLAAGEDCISPPAHSAFSTPKGLIEFVATLRELAGGKPIGFKLCIGVRSEFLGICKAMLALGITPDFITVDGKEGGTGAAPLEFVDSIGMPLTEALVFVHDCLVGVNLRDQIRVVASGKIITGVDMLTKIALGADLCNSARGMMFALGCIQARRCHTNLCPTGVTTQDPDRYYALSVDHKAPKVAHYHQETIRSFLDVLGVTGAKRVADLKRNHIAKRISIAELRHYDEIYPELIAGQFLGDAIPARYAPCWQEASADYFVAPCEN